MQDTLFNFQPSLKLELAFAGSLPDGLVIIPDFVSLEEERELLALIDAPDSSPWLDDLKRRVKHFGYRYDYKARALSSRDKIGDIPDWAVMLGDRLVSNNYFATAPDQVIVNEYLPGQGIAAHIDRDTCFGPAVASVSLGSDTVMDFKTDERSGYLVLPARSAVILSSDARYSWKHGIAARKIDSVDGRIVPRSRRVSLTFRTVLLRA